MYIVLHTAQAAEDTHKKYIILETTATWGKLRVGAQNEGVLLMTHISEPNVFAPAEQSRLSTYKVAVAAGSYTENRLGQGDNQRYSPDIRPKGPFRGGSEFRVRSFLP